MKILHVLDHYKPHFSGYVFRTNYILKYQKQYGIDPFVLTSPKQGAVETDCELLDAVRVYRTRRTEFGNIPFLRELRLIYALKARMDEIVREEKPDIIHAHSPSLNGIAALLSGRKFRIPVVYEVRAFWEDAAVDHGSFKEGSFKYRLSKFIETVLLKRADAVFTICDGLRKEMIARGIKKENITVVPNCVDTEFFTPQVYDTQIAEKHGLNGKVVLGFIGSFYHYEGLDTLIESFARVSHGNGNVQLLLVGDGPELERLHNKVEQLAMSKQVIFTGRVPHEEVSRYYSVIDILVYPRKKMRLTEFVTPLKPLEAMAMEKIVVGSDVGGIKELIENNVNGFLFRAGDMESLHWLLNDVLIHFRDMSGIAQTAKKIILEKHLWSKAVQKYLPTYRKLVATRKVGTVGHT